MRGSGRTTRQLEEAYQSALEGVSTLYVCAHRREADYAMSLICYIARPEKVNRPMMQVHVGSSIIRCVSRTCGPDFSRGWRGRIDFDHNAAPDQDADRREWSQWREWLALADHANFRLENSTPP